MAELRHLIVVLGDQLHPDAAAFDGVDAAKDAAWMAEVEGESTHVPSSKMRTALFLAAMRHFADELRARQVPLHYQRLDDDGAAPTLAEALARDLSRLRPQRVRMTAPGDWRVLDALRRTCDDAGVPLDIAEDRHFFTTVREFAAFAKGRRNLRLETFYREMRRRHGVLMDGDGPEGGQWNFDADNRGAFGAAGPGKVPAPAQFEPDAITREVMALVNARFADHPGTLEAFAWPVTRDQARQALDRFIDERLPHFGRWQDAMWVGQPWLYHAHLAAAMNLKLLHPREVVGRAVAAYRDGHAPLAAVEGFVRQILGWREYVRGVYWTQMPDYAERNALGADQPLPGFYWSGDTPMACLRDAIGQTLRLGYAHHIQRLMVTGLYALLLGVRPQEVHAWYLSVYVDAVAWVELPNTLGMSQYADAVTADGDAAPAGPMASKPYAATGKYIQRMGNACAGCRFDPSQRTGDRACPFTTLYWDFLLRHERRFASHPRMALQVKNLVRLDVAERRAIRARADAIRGGELRVPT